MALDLSFPTNRTGLAFMPTSVSRTDKLTHMSRFCHPRPAHEKERLRLFRAAYVIYSLQWVGPNKRGSAHLQGKGFAPLMPTEEAQSVDMPGIVHGMFEEVRTYLLGEGMDQRQQVGTNPKGEATRAFDAEAEHRALTYARAHLPAFRVLSEEAGELRFGDEPPQYTLVIDPCDGSNNFRRRLRVVGFAVAVFPGDIAVLDPAL